MNQAGGRREPGSLRKISAEFPHRLDDVLDIVGDGVTEGSEAGRDLVQRPRWYDWAWASAHQPGHSLLIRRGSDGTLAFHRCWSPVRCHWLPWCGPLGRAGLWIPSRQKPSGAGPLPGSDLD